MAGGDILMEDSICGLLSFYYLIEHQCFADLKHILGDALCLQE